jgi:hypothetical protein
MATLDVTRSYTDGATLNASMLDDFLDDIETLINTTKLNDDNLQNAGITASSKLIDGSITAAKLGSSAVETAKINDLAVTTGKINDLAVTTGKINDLGVTTGKIAANAVTRAKLESVGQQISSSSGSFTRTNTSYGDVTNLSVSITTTGRPVMLFPQPASDTSESYVGASDASGNSPNADFKILRGATEIASFKVGGLATGASPAGFKAPPGSIQYLDVPSAGTYTYKLQARGVNAGETAEVEGCKLVAFEL